MRKDYEVTCQVDMCAERVEKVRVTTNLEAKAIRLAEEKLKKNGHFHVSVISCKEVKDEGHQISWLERLPYTQDVTGSSPVTRTMDNATYPQDMAQIQYYHLVAYYSEAWKEITELQLLGEVSSSLRTRLGCRNSLDGK